MESKFSRICHNLSHALANYERVCHDPEMQHQRRYWRMKCNDYRRQLTEYCQELGIEVFFAVQLPLFDDVDE